MAAPTVRRDNLNLMRPQPGDGEGGPGKKLLEELVEFGILDAEALQRLPAKNRLELQRHANLDRLMMRLVDHQLLTQYQAARLQSGQPGSLILGPYRVCDRLGAGTASVIFKAQHIPTKEIVALKVFIPRGQDESLLLRFDRERRTIAQLDHPHIVKALDVGEAANPDPDAPVLYYYAMEWQPGSDLEAYVRAHGPLSPHAASTLGYQIADALHAAHQHGLVHRDVNPANILLLDSGTPSLPQAKLLDFGLIRSEQARQTQPGTCLGMLEYIAPEQAADASLVDIRADLFALGSTLYFALTGQPPFSARGPLLEVLQRRLVEPAPSALERNPKVPAELDMVLGRLMALNPQDRFPSPADAMRALEPLVAPGTPVRDLPVCLPPSVEVNPPETGPRVLALHHDQETRQLLHDALKTRDIWCQTVADAPAALSALQRHAHDIVLVELTPQGSSLLEFLKVVRTFTDNTHRKILLLTHPDVPVDLGAMLSAGADDALPLPADPASVQIRVGCLLQLKQAQDRLVQPAKAPVEPNPEPSNLEPAKKTRKGLLGWLLGKSS